MTLWWARRDLRLHDNPALLEAQADSPAAMVFPWGPALHFWSGRRRAHLARVLWSLREDSGGALAVRRGPAAELLLAAAQESDARVVWAQREFSPAGVREQDEVKAALEADGRELRFVGSPYAVAPGRVVKGDGSPYQVFTPFSHAWREHGWRAPAAAADVEALRPLDSDVSLDQEAAHGDAEDPLEARHEFRETQILDDLRAFVEGDLARYKDERDRPDLDSTSHLSVPLAYGQVHPRTILAATEKVRHDAARTFESEVAWREFHADVLHHHPRGQKESLTPALPDDAWTTGREADESFGAWRRGETGFPLVDAGMRQLAATGQMHNRVRMVVASFLVKDLHLPWQRGADHFRKALLDYDHSQNQLNWQWVAGTGRDAAPFFRIFNPETQAAKFDPDRRYVRRWIPELDTPGYPMPMVDHKAEREVSLAHMKRGKGASKG
ncbi:cryptochrome/photolyase family protein [Demequina zhanjiangensis]|uniref:Deoxyribodipyrimidine photo-lyase n=1 Tax=Demequina zhanjiangensis TaxID=3051659 RepID=A0ABT8FYB5_9MICO|nr:deoxyribodipyrimidine photo-lyase [Demequina sp. SYSU T00b26]MDN4471886.1 deoxyribodipyrimidine photo-lyase [Demequina sp. SYSU T00b26]